MWNGRLLKDYSLSGFQRKIEDAYNSMYQALLRHHNLRTRLDLHWHETLQTLQGSIITREHELLYMCQEIFYYSRSNM